MLMCSALKKSSNICCFICKCPNVLFLLLGQAFWYTSPMIMMFAFRLEIRMHFARWSVLGHAAASATTVFLALGSFCLSCCLWWWRLAACVCVCVCVCDSPSSKLAKWAPWNVYVDAKIMKAWQMPRMPPNFLYSLWLSLFFFWWSYLAIAFFFLNCNLIYFSFCDFFLGY